MQNGKPGKRVLITGATGFVGSHMADLLVYKGDVNLFATKRWHHTVFQNVIAIKDKITWIDCDLTDAIATREMIKQVQPDEIYHFAAESFVSPSWLHPEHYMRANYLGTLNLLDSIHQQGLKTRILIPGSGEEYGEVLESELPITAKTQLKPVNPYAVSKIAQDLIGYVYFKSYGVNVIRVRAFNHEGPRRPNVFGISWYAYQAAKIEAGLQEHIMRVGNIDDKRNFTHVIDMVTAYFRAMEFCIPGEINLIGTQDVHTFREALESLISKAAVGTTYVQVPEFTRPTQVPFLIADTAPFVKLTGWQPQYNFNDILDDTLAYWRGEIADDRRS
jgi:GDP-4-dehydro-6-deoxy-D-mannose reductase